MTAIQVEYQKVMETIRHNQEQEAIGRTEAAASKTQAEVAQAKAPSEISKNWAATAEGYAKSFNTVMKSIPIIGLLVK